MPKEDTGKYEVGYGKPPRHTQFQPGQSGNPKGRPKKSPTFEDDVKTELRASIMVLEGGKRRRITKQRGIAKQHVNRALGGDVRSTELLFTRPRERHPDRQDNLSSLLQEFRENNARYLVVDRKQGQPTDDGSQPIGPMSDSVHSREMKILNANI